MKNYAILILFCAISILLAPLLILNPDKTASEPVSGETVQPIQNTVTTTQPVQTISVFRTVSNSTQEITMFEYVCGSVAAEMPLAYNEEAIKAQAVACYTNALRMKSQNTDKTSGNISDDTTVHQGYIDVNQRKEKWGADFDKYEKKLQNAVKEVENKALYYNNTLCVAAFCAISNGKTEDAQNLWGTKVNYLVSVDSSGDKLSPGYASTLSLTKEEFLKFAKQAGVKTDNVTSLKDIIKITKKSSSGTVLNAEINGTPLTGEQVRKAFSLRSPTFSVKTTENTVTFSVCGYGHGIGMSQYGANYLAEQGYTYTDILNHYYKGAQIK